MAPGPGERGAPLRARLDDLLREVGLGDSRGAFLAAAARVAEALGVGRPRGARAPSLRRARRTAPLRLYLLGYKRE